MPAGQYITGTVVTTAGDETVTGTNTVWLTNVSPGDLMVIGQDRAAYTIGSVTSDVSLELTAKYPSTKAGATYVVARDFTSALNLPKPNAGDLRFDVLNRRQMDILDAAAQLGLSWQGSVLDNDLGDAPPGAPSDGDTYIVADPVTTGLWFGHENDIAEWDDTSGVGWVFTTPTEKDFVLVVDEEKLYLWDGIAWLAFALVIAADQAKSLIASDGDPIGVVLTDAAGNVTVNEAGIDIDFRVEGVGEANALFVRGSDGKIGVKTATPLGNIHVLIATTGQTVAAGADLLVLESTGNAGLTILSGATNEGRIYFGNAGVQATGRIQYEHTTNDMLFYAANALRMTVFNDGTVGVTGDVDLNTSGNAGTLTSSNAAPRTYTFPDVTGTVALTTDLHAESHSIASHNDTSGTGTELNTLTDGSNADSLHVHAGVAIAHSDTTGRTVNDHHTESHTVASHSDTTGTGTELNTLTDNSIADTLHRHSELVASDGAPDPALSVDATGNCTAAANFTVDGDLFGSHANMEGGDATFSVQLSAHELKIADVQMVGNAKAFPAPRGGSITEMSINYDVTNAPASGADLQMGVGVDAVILWAEAIDDAQANNKTDYATAASGTYTFSAGDLISFGVGEAGNVLVNLEKVMMSVRLQFDA